MNAEYLLNRRADVIARHQTLESVPGSGYHEDDEQAKAEAKKKRKPLSQRPVSIQHDGKSWFVGDDVPVIRQALAAFVAKHEQEQAEHKAAAAAAGIEPSPPPVQVKQSAAVSARVAKESGDIIELPANELNAILYGLNEMQIQCVAVGVLP